uniref:Pentacotripeptide-repeat region of PRORP domain-containing protein n=1 Tax=Noctiluca scintillans TaxID=2966 RepID=A0A7S1F565_NOCSC|mmetsp:Transcript_34822/g.92987  ORF Transcript_34822/g.92987 Transcript_34822/m.92987 type:complete len:456 (+) Transcript_34822:165-1532(+)
MRLQLVGFGGGGLVSEVPCHSVRLFSTLDLTVVQRLCKGPSLQEAWQAAEGFFSANAPGDALELLVGASAVEGDLSRTRRLCLRLLALEEAGEAKVNPSVWRALVGVHARSGDVDGAFSILGHLEKLSVEDAALIPCEVFEALLHGLVEGGRVRTAFEVFQRMRTQSLVEPSVHIYTTMLRACGAARNPGRAQTLFQDLESLGATPAARAAYVVALASRPHSAWMAFKSFQESMKCGDPLRPDVCNALGEACAQGGFAEEAKRLIRRMHMASVRPDTALQCSLIGAFGKAAETDEAERTRLLTHAWHVIRDAKVNGAVHPRLLHVLLKGYCSSGLAAHAVKLLGLFPKFGCPPDAEGYHIVLEVLTDSPASFRSLWKELHASSVKPSPPMLERALRVALAVRDAGWAHSVLQDMYALRAPLSRELAERLRALQNRDLRQLLDTFEKLLPWIEDEA